MNRKKVAPVIAGALVVATVTYFVLRRGQDESTSIVASGTVEATEADLGFQVAGRIEAIEAREGQTVTPGMVLAKLDHAELSARRAAAEAQLASARALLNELLRGARPEELQQARSAETAARQRVDEAARTLERTRRLEQGGAASRESLEQAQTAHDVARAQYDHVREQLRLIEQGPRAERIEAQHAAVRQAQAAVAQIDALLSSSIIRAPFAGVVSVRHREPGETVGAGAPVLTLTNPYDRWVRIYVREDQIGHVTLGQTASIRSDTDPNQALSGHVTFISTEAEFTPRNVQTTEERVKLVYAVKVAIARDSAGMLKPGMPADVRLQ
ncbi:MAG: HlyD family secretion protein [Longimicrobiales bacterium]